MVFWVGENGAGTAPGREGTVLPKCGFLRSHRRAGCACRVRRLCMFRVPVVAPLEGCGGRALQSYLSFGVVVFRLAAVKQDAARRTDRG